MNTMSAMTALKIATQSHHYILESNQQMHHLMSDALTGSDYLHLLMQMYGFYVPLEARLAQFGADWAACEIDFARRRKVPLLERDLEALGVSHVARGQIPLCTRLPAVDSFPQAVGVLYVLEGSTLGGQLITRHLAYCLGLKPDQGLAFFSSYTSEIGSMWKQFSNQINNYVGEHFAPGDVALMILSAQSTFQTLNEWLNHTNVREIALAS